jgi:hypothetical protein
MRNTSQGRKRKEAIKFDTFHPLPSFPTIPSSKRLVTYSVVPSHTYQKPKTLTPPMKYIVLVERYACVLLRSKRHGTYMGMRSKRLLTT